MRWPVVLFDLDGTLVDSINLIVASYQHGFHLAGLPPRPEADIKTLIGLSLADAIDRLFPDDPAAAALTMRGYMDWNHAHMTTDLSAYPGIAELVDDLTAAGLRLGAVTSKRAENARWSLDLGGLSATVPLLVSHDDTERHKPEPDPLLAAAAKLNVAPELCVYVGDAVTDLAAARAAGMAAIAVTWGAGTVADLVAAQPDALCHSIGQLRAVLLGGGH